MAKRRGHKGKSRSPLHKRNGAKLKVDRLEGSSRGSESAKSAKGASVTKSALLEGTTPDDVPTGDTSSWGKGGVLTNLSNPAEVSKDLSLLSRALKHRWDIKKKDMIQERLLKVLQKEEVTIATKEGSVTVEESADRNAVAAARVLVQMNGQDIECEQFETKNAQPPPPGTTVNVFGTSEPRPSPILQLAYALGAKELVIDGSAVSVADSAGQSKKA